jgi:hypothetical protein
MNVSASHRILLAMNHRLTINRLAALLVFLGLSAIAAYFLFAGSADWTPNIATDALSIALTIVVVDRIVQREREQRTRPRLNRALNLITREYAMFAWRAQWDWVTTHLKVDLAQVEIPRDAVAKFDFWLEGVDEIDFPRPTGAEGRSLFLDEAIEFVRRVQRVVDADRELLPPDLVIAIDNLDPIFTGASLANMAAEISSRGAVGQDRWLLQVMILNAQHLGGVLRRSIGDRSLELPQ